MAETPEDEKVKLKHDGEAPDADKAAGSLPRNQNQDSKERADELLDEGLEETFPASDPVAAKHIT